MSGPDVRLALANGQAERNGTSGFEIDDRRGEAPGLLVSYVYLQKFFENRSRYHYRDWVLDSGAFSAFYSGTPIPLDKYINTCRELLTSDPKLVEVFALDVIGDPAANLKNCETMWQAGIPAIPCYHHGEPESVLLEMAASYPKVALGGAAKLNATYKTEWAHECFARIWPKRIHGFGFGTEKQILSLPFHSVDATSWESRPCRFGSWHKYGRMSVRGSSQNLRSEIDYYLTVEQKARVRWRNQMAELDALDHAPPPAALAVRLAMAQTTISQLKRFAALTPSVRLAIQGGDRSAESKGLT